LLPNAVAAAAEPPSKNARLLAADGKGIGEARNTLWLPPRRLKACDGILHTEEGINLNIFKTTTA
jgi:hypothetical protein